MDFYSVLKQRHSIRSFQEKTVEKEVIEKILAACILAPSAGNLQSYKIFVTRSPSVKESLAIAADGQECLEQAAFVLIFCANQKKASTKYKERGFELYSIQDATIAAAYAQLAATAEGLASVWIGSFDSLEVSRIIDLPPYHIPVALIPIGYPAESPSIRERQPITKVVKEIQ
ncbi:MAG: nitroreductase family protein [Candidatus Micrarchaeota archaeon]